MSRTPIPTNVAVLKGAAAKDPQRYRDRLKNEPVDSRALGAPPKEMPADERKAWREIAKTAIPGTLVHADRLCVEMAAKLLVRLRSRGGQGYSSDLARFITILAHMGMTPTDRTKLVLPKKPQNEFSDL